MTGANVPALVGQLRACGMSERAVDRVLPRSTPPRPASPEEDAR